MIASVLQFYRRIALWFGLALILLYCVSIRPPGPGLGYAEDNCYPEVTRQLMQHELAVQGRPGFVTDQLMAPYGISVPYMGWSIERDGLGALAWGWDRDFPFLWVYFGFSLIAAYLATGWILRRMGLSAAAAWTLAGVSVLVNVPRHFKVWHHYEHLLQHWLYATIFLDAWIWQQFWRERRWSWRLALWRAVMLVGMLGTVGYYWGPLILEWLLVHACLAGFAWKRARAGEATRIGPPLQLGAALPPILAGLTLLYLELRWFLPLFAEARKAGPVVQGIGWVAHIGFLPVPLWLQPLWEALRGQVASLPAMGSINTPETVISIGWLYWIPFFIALRALRRKANLRAVLPFLGMIAIAILYACTSKPYLVQRALQAVIPSMSFFRVASRWGLLLPPLVTASVALSWPELTEWATRTIQGPRRRKVLIWTTLFALSSAAEAAWLFKPVTMMEPMSAGTVALLEKIRALPGTTVLDLPFCVGGGNNICNAEQCPNYPDSTVGLCLRRWHEKKVYGVYEGRTSPADCEIYRRDPYTSWFTAWGQQRCLDDREWKDFCGYLGAHRELSAVILYPEVWRGAGTPECLAKFTAHLGAPLGQDRLVVEPTPGGQPPYRTSRIIAYPATCLR